MYVPSTVAVLAVTLFRTSVSRAQLAYDSNNKQNNGHRARQSGAKKKKKNYTPSATKIKVMNEWMLRKATKVHVYVQCFIQA